MRSKTTLILEGVMLIVWIITLIIFLTIVFTNSTQCLNNPLIFGSKILSQKNNDTFSCKCTFNKEPDYFIYVDEKGWILNQTISLNMDFKK